MNDEKSIPWIGREIPWDDIAFRTVRATLEQFFSDRRAGSFDFHFGDIRTR